MGKEIKYDFFYDFIKGNKIIFDVDFQGQILEFEFSGFLFDISKIKHGHFFVCMKYDPNICRNFSFTDPFDNFINWINYIYK